MPMGFRGKLKQILPGWAVISRRGRGFAEKKADRCFFYVQRREG
jgi:hypothetical protein